jgi:ComF family protein
MLAHIENSITAKPDCIIPVPLHSRRLRERGYNQALEIARPLAKHLNIPIDVTSFRRIKATVPQAMLSYDDRANNIRGAFAINKAISYKHIVVIDDVITTGATITEFCKTLLQSGDVTIEVWALARAIPAP